MGQLEGKTALVTGAASGIGRAIVESYVREGAIVTAADRDASSLVALAEETGARTVVADLRDPAQVETAVDMAGGVAHRLDVAVNSHGVLTQSRLEEMTLDMWQETLAIDLTAVFLLMQAQARMMLPRGSGRIINVASQLAIKGGIEVAHYAAAKAAVIALTKSAALEWSSRGVLANVIAPGPIVTPLTDAMTPEWRAAKTGELPLRRFGVPAEVAPTAVLLASDPGGNLYAGQTLGPNSGDVMP